MGRCEKRLGLLACASCLLLIIYTPMQLRIPVLWKEREGPDNRHRDGRDITDGTPGYEPSDAAGKEPRIRDRYFRDSLGLRQDGFHGSETLQAFVDAEVTKGRLSEIYKSPPTVAISDVDLSDLQTVLNKAITHRKASIRDTGEKLQLYNLTGSNVHGTVPTWQLFHHHISRHQLYSETDGVIETLMHDLQHMKVKRVSVGFPGGSELKLKMYFADGSIGVFKPMRFPRDRHASPDHFYFNDFERHTAEIATFHLDRILGFHRVPPTVGRYFNVTSEIVDLCHDESLTKTLFISGAGNKCFYGVCEYYCDAAHPLCGHPDLMEGSLMAWLPDMSLPNMHRKEHSNPYTRSYKANRKPQFLKVPDFCNAVVRRKPEFQSGRKLMDLIDLGIMDFLTGNQDRHHYDTFYEEWGNDAFMILYDNGRGFGYSQNDDLTNLAPLTQCCQIRMSTLEKLLELETVRPPLSVRMERSMRDDLVAPVLTLDFLQALDRRVKIVLKEIKTCLSNPPGNYTHGVIDDGL